MQGRVYWQVTIWAARATMAIISRETKGDVIYCSTVVAVAGRAEGGTGSRVFIGGDGAPALRSAI
jgi:hypothetical protein